MAIDIQEIIRVNTQQGEQTLRSLREEIRNLKNALANLEQGSEEYDAVVKRIREDQQQLNTVMRGGATEVQHAEGSFNALNAKLRELKEEWKATADEARKGELTKEINAVKGQMNAMNESIGNFQHNVGNYTQGVVQAFQQMGIAGSSSATRIITTFSQLPNIFKVLTSSVKGLWKALLTNPLGWILVAVGAVVMAFKSMMDAIRGNEESQDRLNKALTVFRPIIDGAKYAIDAMSTVLLGLIEGLASAVNWIRELIAGFTDFVGITDGAKEKLKETNAFYNELADLENQIKRTRRETEKQNAIDQEFIAIKREEASLLTDEKKRRELLQEAYEAQERIVERNIKLAEDELKLLQMKSERTPNDVKENDDLNQAEMRLNLTRAQGANALKRLNREMGRQRETTKGLTEEEKEAEKIAEELLNQQLKEYEEAEKIRERAEESRRDELTNLGIAYRKELELLKKHNQDTTALTAVYEDKVAKILQEKEEARLKQKENDLDREYDLEQRKRAIAFNALSQKENNVEALAETINLQNIELDEYAKFITSKIELNKELLLNFEEDSERRKEIETEIANLQMDLADKELETQQKKSQAYKRIMEVRLEATEQMVGGTAELFDNLSVVMGENTRAGKAFAIASATIDTIASAVSGFRAGYNQWKDAGFMAWMAPVQGALNSAVALTAGYAQVRKIASVDVSGKSASSSGGGMATALAVPNIQGLTTPFDYTRQVTTEQEKEELNKATKVYILESDIQESGRRVQVREEETTF